MSKFLGKWNYEIDAQGTVYKGTLSLVDDGGKIGGSWTGADGQSKSLSSPALKGNELTFSSTVNMGQELPLDFAITFDGTKFSGKVKTKELLAKLTDKLPDFMKSLNKTSVFIRPIMKLFFKKFNFLLDVQEVLQQEEVLEWTREDLVKRITDKVNERFSFSILAPRPIYALIAALINLLFLTGSFFAVVHL